jgi:uncharacterized protein YecE (DUF72 family)
MKRAHSLAERKPGKAQSMAQNRSTGRVLIGTSGWTYPHWQGTFFPADLPASRRLPFYAERFASVEINTTFYGTPTRATVRGWRDAVPESFWFAVKGSRFTTHNKKLLDPRKSTEKTFAALEPLQDRICAVLFQLPPHWRFNGERLAAFIRAMPKRYRYAFEFREPSWLCDEAYAILREHNAALCLYDLKGFHNTELTTADWVYIRLHGPTAAAYRGSYPDEALDRWAKRIGGWRKEKKDVLVYFDNDEKGYAAADALRLRKLMEG